MSKCEILDCEQVDNIVNEYPGVGEGYEDALFENVCDLSKSHELLRKKLQAAKEREKELIAHNGILRDSYNSLCSSLDNGEHVDMDWVRSAIDSAARDRIVNAFNSKIPRLEKRVAKLKECVEFCATSGVKSGCGHEEKIRRSNQTLKEIYGE